MFGEDLSAGPHVKVCCGPRCGIVPNHRVIFAAIERAAKPSMVLPTMCQGLCQGGVTVVWPSGEKTKVLDASEVAHGTAEALPMYRER